jgi:hypothetical protein
MPRVKQKGFGGCRCEWLGLLPGSPVESFRVGQDAGGSGLAEGSGFQVIKKTFLTYFSEEPTFQVDWVA